MTVEMAGSPTRWQDLLSRLWPINSNLLVIIREK